MSDGDLSQIRQAYTDGALTRDAYWRQMQQQHLHLAQYMALMRQGDLDRIEITGDELRVVVKSGVRVRWNPDDVRTVPNILINHGTYEADELAIIRFFTAHCRVILDIGANIGWYSLHLGHWLRPAGGRVYAFEPVPTTFAELTHNIALNRLDDIITPVNLAFGEAPGTLDFYIPEFTGSVAASLRPLFPQETNVGVPCSVDTLDAFVAREGLPQVDLIKCDVEGAELLVLRGGLQTVAAHQPIIMLEMLRKWARAFDYHPNAIIALLQDHGYQCWSPEAAGLQEIREVAEECRQTNFLFLHRTTHANLLATLRRGLPVFSSGG